MTITPERIAEIVAWCEGQRAGDIEAVVDLLADLLAAYTEQGQRLEKMAELVHESFAHGVSLEHYDTVFERGTETDDLWKQSEVPQRIAAILERS